MSIVASQYEFIREIGRGGMAIVMLAHDRTHDRSVAIKLLRQELAGAVNHQRFLREMRVLAHLQHPNIVPLYDSGVLDDVPFYVMPYIQGESLRARIDREKQLPVSETLRITSEVADALGYAHSQGVVHRDIKPENILLSGGHALVADFGIARAMMEAADDRLTDTGLAVGTLAYMSPEQAAGGSDVDGRADIYSLGCVAFEMLAGVPPFVAATPQAVIARRMAEEAPPVRDLRGTVPPGVSEAIARALERVPADRWGSADEFARALDELSTGNHRRKASSPLVDLESRRRGGGRPVRCRRWRAGRGAVGAYACGTSQRRQEGAVRSALRRRPTRAQSGSGSRSYEPRGESLACAGRRCPWSGLRAGMASRGTGRQCEWDSAR